MFQGVKPCRERLLRGSDARQAAHQQREPDGHPSVATHRLNQVALASVGLPAQDRPPNGRNVAEPLLKRSH